MSTEERDREYLRGKIKELLRSVPKKVNEGSVQAVRDFKKFYTEAMKVAENSRATHAQLMSIFSRAQDYHR